MDRNLVTVIFCLLIAGSMNTFAQRHYKNISALEMNYGSNIFGDYGHYGNLSFSKYVNRNEGGNLAASKIRNLECPSYEICLIDYGCGKFNRKIHIMEQYP